MLPLLGCIVHVHEAPAKTPAQPESAPADPAKPAPGPVTKPTPVKPNPVKPAPVKPAPVKPTPVKPTPDTKPVPDTKPDPIVKPTPDTKPVPDTKPDPIVKPTPDTKPVPDPKPVPDTKPVPVKPDSDLSSFVIPLRVPFEQLVASVDALIPQTEEEKEWTRVSKEGDTPEVEITYKIWREKIRAKLAGETLTVTVPLHYAAHFRAKVKNPLTKDWIWITKDDTWGTQADPQDLTVTVTLKPRVQSSWEIQSAMKLEPLVHGPAPKGDACVKVGIKACVSRESLAPSIRARIDGYITPKLEKALAKVDGELNKKLALRAHAEKLWTGLQAPQRLQTAAQARCPTELGSACKEPAWIVAQPASIAVGPLGLDGKDVRIDFGLTGKLAAVAGEEPKAAARPLPKVGSEVGKPHVAVNVELRLPVEWLKTAAAKGIEALHLPVAGKPELSLKGVSLRAERDSKNPRRITLTAQAAGAVEGALTLGGEFVYDAASRKLSVSGLGFDAATLALLSKALSPAELDELKKQLGTKLSWDLKAPIGQLHAAAQRALGGTLKGELALSGDLNDVSLHDMELRAGALSLQLSLGGELAAKYTPR